MTAAAYTQGDSQRIMQMQYNKMAAAYKKQNLDAVLAMIAADATFKSAEGKVFTRDDIERNLKAQFASAKTDNLTFAIKSIRRVGQNVICEVTTTQIVVPNGQKTAKPQKLSAQITSRDTWMRKGAGWVQTAGEQMGKPVVRAIPAAVSTKKPAR